MNAETPTTSPSNTAATVALGAVVVGFFIIPIVLAPLAIICGFVGLNGEKGRGAAGLAIVLGFCEVMYILAQWKTAGVL